MEHQFEIDFEISTNTTIPTHSDVYELMLCHCDETQFNALDIPSNITNLLFYECDLETLKVPDSITYCNCSRLGLKELILSESINTVYCQHNCLKSLTIPNSCEYVYADHNKLVSIVPKVLPNLIELYITNNRLKEINFESSPNIEFIDHDVDAIVCDELKQQLVAKEREEYERFKC